MQGGLEGAIEALNHPIRLGMISIGKVNRQTKGRHEIGPEGGSKLTTAIRHDV